jgi:transposase
VIRQVLTDWPQIKAPRKTEILREHGYEGSVDVVKRRLRALRPARERPAQRTGYRPGQVLQLDWLELPTRPRIAGREGRVYALLGTLPYSGAQSARFSLDMTAGSFLEGHVRLFDWLGGVVRECVYGNLRSVVARRERDEVRWNQRYLHLRGHYAFHATACTPQTPREKGSVEGGAASEVGLLAGAADHLARGPRRAIPGLARPDLQPAPARDRALPSTSAWPRSAARSDACRRPASTMPTRARAACRSMATCATGAPSTARPRRSSTNA